MDIDLEIDLEIEALSALGSLRTISSTYQTGGVVGLGEADIEGLIDLDIDLDILLLLLADGLLVEDIDALKDLLIDLLKLADGLLVDEMLALRV